MRSPLLIAAIAALVTGCATPYAEVSPVVSRAAVGTSATRLADDLVEVRSSGFGIWAEASMRDNLLRRAAIETLGAGYDTFEVLTDQSGQEGLATLGLTTGQSRKSLIRLLKGATPVAGKIYSAQAVLDSTR